jgi:4-hydroxy-3-methylbut-2-enyl diphosphate reductase
MTLQIIKAKETGFCFGVRRAIRMLELAASKHDHIDTLGAVVHNEQVTKRLGVMGIRTIDNLDELQSEFVAISSHGVSPLVENELRARSLSVIDTTCPFVKRVQRAARKLVEGGFFVVVYGDARHPEIKGIMGGVGDKGVATQDASFFKTFQDIPRRIGILAQTTQIPENFILFVKDMIDLTLRQDSEIQVLDTICHDIRKRQSFSLDLAPVVDLMLVIGGQSSANTRRLTEICAKIVETHQISQAKEIDPDWLKGKRKIGLTGGTSTPEESIDEVWKNLSAYNKGEADNSPRDQD